MKSSLRLGDPDKFRSFYSTVNMFKLLLQFLILLTKSILGRLLQPEAVHYPMKGRSL